VVALVRGATERAAIREACVEIATVEFCDRVEQLERLAVRTGARIIIAEPRDAAGVRTAPTLRSLRVRRPKLHIVSHLALTPTDVRDTVEVWGVSVLIRGHDDLRARLRATLLGEQRNAPLAEILAFTVAHVPRTVRRYVEYCAWQAHRARTARAAAQMANISYRTLARWLRVSGLPPPADVLAWYRLLHAAWILELEDAKRDVAATAVGFPSGAALARVLRRHVGITWTELRNRVGFAGLLARFEAAMGISRDTAGEG
jgi:AraC-like DNA-binding protein